MLSVSFSLFLATCIFSIRFPAVNIFSYIFLLALKRNPGKIGFMPDLDSIYRASHFGTYVVEGKREIGGGGERDGGGKREIGGGGREMYSILKRKTDGLRETSYKDNKAERENRETQR